MMYIQLGTQQPMIAEHVPPQDASTAKSQRPLAAIHATVPTETPTAHVQMATSTNLFWQRQAPMTAFDAQI